MASYQRRLASQQRIAESIQWGEQALPLARATGIAKTIETIEGNLGWQYFDVGDYETAAELFAQAEATAARIDAKQDRVAWLVQLGNIRYELRDWEGAARYNQLAAGIAREIGSPQLSLHREHRTSHDRNGPVRRGPALQRRSPEGEEGAESRRGGVELVHRRSTHRLRRNEIRGRRRCSRKSFATRRLQ
jgi:tetratricopeptide (TPR) repeat protein